MGGGLLACPFLNPRPLSLGPQNNSWQAYRWYFIISVQSVYLDSIITPYMSFNSLPFFFKLHVWPSLWDRTSLPCILTYSILNPSLCYYFFILGFSFNHCAMILLWVFCLEPRAEMLTEWGKIGVIPNSLYTVKGFVVGQHTCVCLWLHLHWRDLVSPQHDAFKRAVGYHATMNTFMSHCV